MESICTSCKHKAYCDETCRLYGVPNIRVDECKEYERKEASDIDSSDKHQRQG